MGKSVPVQWEVDYEQALLKALWAYTQYHYLPIKKHYQSLFDSWGRSFDKSHKWLLVSGLQKSIRRANPLSALLCLSALHQHDASYGRYRLGICAIEESAGACIPLALSVLQTRMSAKVLKHIEHLTVQKASTGALLTKSSTKQECSGDPSREQVQMALQTSGGLILLSMFSHLMCVEPIDRTACNLMGIASECLVHPPKSFTVQQCAWLKSDNIDAIRHLAIDKSVDVRARYAALGLLFGAFAGVLREDPALKVRAQASFFQAVEALSARHPFAQKDPVKVKMIQDLVGQAVGFGQENFGLSLALIHDKEPQDFMDAKAYWEQQVEHLESVHWECFLDPLKKEDAVSGSNGQSAPILEEARAVGEGAKAHKASSDRATKTFHGLVLASLDKHTAEGKRMIEQWLKGSLSLQLLVDQVPYGQKTEALGSALFWFEGQHCENVIAHALGKSSLQANERRCAMQLKKSWAQVEQVLSESMDDLNHIRVQGLQKIWSIGAQ